MQLHASEWQMLHAGPHPSLLLDSTVVVKGAQAEVRKEGMPGAQSERCWRVLCSALFLMSLFLMSPVWHLGLSAYLTQACDVASKALAGPLLPSQQLLMLAHIDTDPHLVQTMQVQPQQLAALVEHNPMLAFQVLMRIRGSRRVERFHQVGPNIGSHKN
jgi:hypothetical protein